MVDGQDFADEVYKFTFLCYTIGVAKMAVNKLHDIAMGWLFMAIKNVEMDRRDSVSYRRILKRGGFLSASYLSVSGLDVVRLKKLAQQGKIDAIRCAIGKSIRWYYSEKQAELAHLRGEV